MRAWGLYPRLVQLNTEAANQLAARSVKFDVHCLGGNCSTMFAGMVLGVIAIAAYLCEGQALGYPGGSGLVCPSGGPLLFSNSWIGVKNNPVTAGFVSKSLARRAP